MVLIGYFRHSSGSVSHSVTYTSSRLIPQQISLPDMSIPYHRASPASHLPFADILNDVKQPQSLLKASGQQLNASMLNDSALREPSFHVLIPASETNDKLCKTLLSAFVLNYPPPTLINFGQVFTGDNWDKGSHAGKIKGVYDFLNEDQKVHDDDLILVIDGYDVWFQLPPEVLVRRYHKLIHDANQKLRKEYGTMLEEKPWNGGKKKKVQRYVQTVVFGADKLCWPNQPDDPACASLPQSTLPRNAYGPNTDRDPQGYTNRPRYLNSGTILGRVDDVRAIYERALEKVDQGLGVIGDQFVFAEILGEQEYYRQFLASNMPRPWYYPLFNAFPFSQRLSPSIKPVKQMTLPQNRRYDFSIGLDYTSSLFQTMTHSSDDIAFITYANISSSTLPRSFSEISSLSLPLDMNTARPPFPTNDTAIALAIGKLLPLSANLDSLPPSTKNAWLNQPLATNLHSLSVPTLLHINGDKSLLDSWWSSFWYQPYARALLRAYMRTPQAFLWGTVDGEEKTWDRRGGKGGVWKTDGWWMEWGEVCEGVEDTVFADVKGIWGMEEGDGRTYNAWGQQVTGKTQDKRAKQAE